MRAGWPYWAIALLSLAWNAMGALDFAMTASRNLAWLAQASPDLIDWLDSMPDWAMLPWAAGTLGAFAGSCALVLRSRLAVPAFAVSLAGLAGLHAWQASAGVPTSLSGPGNLAFKVALWIVAIALLWYALRQRRHGVLR